MTRSEFLKSEDADQLAPGSGRGIHERDNRHAHDLSRESSTAIGKASVPGSLATVSVKSGKDSGCSKLPTARARYTESATGLASSSIHLARKRVAGKTGTGEIQFIQSGETISSPFCSEIPLTASPGATAVSCTTTTSVGDDNSTIITCADEVISPSSSKTLLATSMHSRSNSSNGGKGGSAGSPCNGSSRTGDDHRAAECMETNISLLSTSSVAADDANGASPGHASGECAPLSNVADIDVNEAVKSDVPQANRDDSEGRLRVLCRFKNFQDRESSHAARDWLQFGESVYGEQGARGADTVSLRIGYSWSERTFDRVFRPGAGQEEVFKQVERVAHGVAEGYNGTVFAYGQTGSGKTYTMMGGISGTPFSAFSAAQSDPVDYPAQAQQLSPPPEDAARPAPSAGGDESDVSSPELEAEAGVIPRAIARVLADANARKEQGWEFVLTVTYVEIYQEKIRDLLNPCNDNLKVIEHPGRGVEAAGAREVRVSTLEEALDVLRAGSQHLITSATLMNQASSRSHSIFMLRLDQRDSVREYKVSARLTLVDLAGSERAGKAGSEGRLLEEANRINVSLHTLGRVIRKLSDSAPHVPFRDSKLTRLLQESLGGNSRTVLIVCCNSEESQVRETLSTLKFGEYAKRVTTFVSPNVVAAPDEVAAQLSELRGEVIRLKRQLNYFRLREARRDAIRSSGGRFSVIQGSRRIPSKAALRSLGGSGSLNEKGSSSPLELERSLSLNATFTAGDSTISSEESWFGASYQALGQSVHAEALFPNTPVRRSAAFEAQSPQLSPTTVSLDVTRSPSRGNITPTPRSPLKNMRASSQRNHPWWSDDDCDATPAAVRTGRGAVSAAEFDVCRGSPSAVKTTPRASGSGELIGRSASRKRITDRDSVSELDVDDVDVKSLTMSSLGFPAARGTAAAVATTQQEAFRRQNCLPMRSKVSPEGSRGGDAEGGRERNGSECGSCDGRTGSGAAALGRLSRRTAGMRPVSVRDMRTSAEGALGGQGDPKAARAMDSTTLFSKGGSAEESSLRLILAKVQQLEEGWKERVNAYEKLIQLKDLRIESLESACRHGSLATHKESHIVALKTAFNDAAAADSSNRTKGAGFDMRGVTGKEGSVGKCITPKAVRRGSSKLSSTAAPAPPPPSPVLPSDRLFAPESDSDDFFY